MFNSARHAIDYLKRRNLVIWEQRRIRWVHLKRLDRTDADAGTDLAAKDWLSNHGWKVRLTPPKAPSLKKVAVPTGWSIPSSISSYETSSATW